MPDDTPDAISPENLIIPSEGGDVSASDREAFFTARFKKPDQVDRRGEKYLRAAEAAAEKAAQQ